MQSRALFLDRDGVINKDINYAHRIDQIEFLPGIFDIAKYIYDLGYQIFIITNQAGIARNLYTEEDFFILTEWIEKEFAFNGVQITKTYYCPHHPLEGYEPYVKNCNCRKPKPGMIFSARDEFNINLSESLLIGDKESDILAGINAGIKTKIYFNSDKSTIADFNITSLYNLKDIINLNYV